MMLVMMPGAKRHIIVDTMGLLLVVMVTSASVQDRDGAVGPIARLKERFPTVRHIWADGGYAGKLVDAARWFCGIPVEVVKMKEGQRGFEVLPRRSVVVERTLAWITKCRRLAPSGRDAPGQQAGSHEALSNTY